MSVYKVEIEVDAVTEQEAARALLDVHIWQPLPIVTVTCPDGSRVDIDLDEGDL